MIIYNSFIIKPFLVFLIGMTLSLTLTASSENDTTVTQNNRNGRISVFLDTGRWFDEDFVRQQIPIVSYVRDKELADVHIIITRHSAGTAGTNYAISLIGRRRFSDMRQELTYWAPASNTSYDTRRGYTNLLKAGLVKYILDTNLADRIIVAYDYDQRTTEMDNGYESEPDPWSSWVFEIYGGGNFSIEEKQRRHSLRAGFYADRVTEEWKIRFRPFFNFNNRTYYTDDATIVSTSHRHGHQAYVVKSITDHWSVGVFSSSLSSTFHNMKFNTELSPAIEYSLFPYIEATRRSITFAYRVGYGYQNYIETTIFAKDEEFLWSQSIEASARFQQPWGNFWAGVSGSHFFHDFSINRAEIFSSISLRVFQGLSLNVRASLDIINDLISISAGDMSIEDILLEQSQQATDYSISGSIGLSYTFGSDFSAAFNPRL